VSKTKRQRNAANAVPEARPVVTYVPRNLKQRDFLRSIREKPISFGIGAAGTGKTYLAAMAAMEAFERGEVERIIVCRPAVSAGNERIGFLPGDIDEKMDPYMRPIWDTFLSYWTPKTLHLYRMERKVEIIPYGFLRGVTFKDAFVIADEAQNSTLEQMFMLLTRLGENSKIVITGDPFQSDLPTRTLTETKRRLSGIDSVGWIEFGAADVVRHPTVEAVIRAWTDDSSVIKVA
jgi:phosphate starvation-inducible PhoH-like protein